MENSIKNIKSTSLFRQEIIKKEYDIYGYLPSQTNILIKMYVLVILLCLILTSFIVFFGEYARKVRVVGFLVPDKGLIKVLSKKQGKIIGIGIEEGQHVSKDDILFNIDVTTETTSGKTSDIVFNKLLERRKMVDKEIERLDLIHKNEQNKIKSIIFSQENQINTVLSEIFSRKKLLLISKNIINRYKILEKRKYIPLLRLRRQNKIFYMRAFK